VASRTSASSRIGVSGKIRASRRYSLMYGSDSDPRAVALTAFPLSGGPSADAHGKRPAPSETAGPAARGLGLAYCFFTVMPPLVVLISISGSPPEVGGRYALTDTVQSVFVPEPT